MPVLFVYWQYRAVRAGVGNGGWAEQAWGTAITQRAWARAEKAPVYAGAKNGSPAKRVSKRVPSDKKFSKKVPSEKFGPEIWDNTNRIEAKIYCDGKALSPRQKPWT